MEFSQEIFPVKKMQPILKLLMDCMFLYLTPPKNRKLGIGWTPILTRRTQYGLEMRRSAHLRFYWQLEVKRDDPRGDKWEFPKLRGAPTKIWICDSRIFEMRGNIQKFLRAFYGPLLTLALFLPSRLLKLFSLAGNQRPTKICLFPKMCKWKSVFCPNSSPYWVRRVKSS